MAQPSAHVSTTPAIEVGIIGVNLPADGPSTGIWKNARRDAHIIAYDVARLTEALAIQLAQSLFGDSIRIVTMAGA